MFVNAQPFIIAITETWLKHDFKDDNMFNLNGYSNIRCDFIDKHSGGVMLLVRDSLRLQQVNIKPEHTLFSYYFHVDIGDLRYINCMSRKIRIFVVYVVPNIDHDKLKCFVDILSYYVDNFHGISVICGDINFPNINWQNGTSLGDQRN